MIKKLSNNLLTIISIIIIFTISIYFINEFRTREIDGKIIGLNKETFTIISNNNKIYTFNNTDNFNYNINENIKIKYNKKLNNFIPIQDINIKNITIINNLELTDDSMFNKYQKKAKQIVANMTIKEKVGQLLLARIPLTNDLKTITDNHIGGYILFERDTKNKTKEELVIWIYDENGPNVQDVILEAFRKYLKLKLQNNSFSVSNNKEILKKKGNDKICK